MLTRVQTGLYAFLMLYGLLSIFSAHPQDGTPSQIVINYSEVNESASQQELNVYFTMLDSGGRSIPNPTVNAAQITINNQIYPALVSVPQTPLNIVLVLDVSGSMRPAAANMRQAAIEAVRQSPPGTRFSVIRFNDQIVTLVGLTDNHGEVINTIGGIADSEFKNGTCLYDATYSALQMLQSSAAAGRRAVVLFTDGRDELIAGGPLDRCSKNADYSNLVETARNPQIRVPIYTIGMSGTQAINLGELENLATATGGLSASGGSSALTQLFQRIIQALAAQRQATASICLAAGNYSGVINLDANGANLTNQISSVAFATTCILPTATPTPEALVISVGDFRFDSAANEILFTIRHSGDGDVNAYEVQITDKATGLLVEGGYGKFTVPVEQAGEVRVPITGISAAAWSVRAAALGAGGVVLSQSAPSEIAPERTPTPTVTPTDMPIPTPTPLVPVIQIQGIIFNDNAQEFVIDLLPVYFEFSQVDSYTLRIRDEGGIEVYGKRYTGNAFSDRLNIPANDNNSRPLGQGRYTISVEVNLKGQQIPLRAEREVVRPAPPPQPGVVETFTHNVQQNPVIAFVFGLFVVLVLVFLILLLRKRGREAEPEWVTIPRPQKQPERAEFVEDSGTQAVAAPVEESTFGDKGGKLTLLNSPVDKIGREWNFTSRDVPYRIGRGGSSDYPVRLDLKDPGVSANHATIRFLNGQYWIIDDNSTNGTYIDGERLKVGQRHPLESGQKIRFGLSTEFEFMDKNKEFQERVADVKKTAPLDVRAGVKPPAQEKPVEVERRAAPAAGDDLEDAPTSVIKVLPHYITARLEIVRGAGVEPGIIAVDSEEFTIGRKKDNHLSIESIEVSRRHARLFWESAYFYIEDLGSGNGTFLNDKQIVKEASKDVAFELSPVRLLPDHVYEVRLGIDDNAVLMRFQYQNRNLPSLPSTDDLEDAPTIVPEE